MESLEYFVAIAAILATMLAISPHPSLGATENQSSVPMVSPSIDSLNSTIITWNPQELNYIATLTFGLPANFTSIKPMQNVELVASEELKDLVNLDYFPEMQVQNVTANEVHFPIIAVEIGPNTTGGWHNGTVSISANGSTLNDPLGVNIMVPKLSKVQISGPNGTAMYNIAVPSYSPVFNNSANIFTWMVLANGTQMPYGYPIYDARTNESDVRNITLQTDKQEYSEGDTITVTAKVANYEAGPTSVPAKVGLSIYKVDPFVSVYETFVPITDDGTYSIKIPVTAEKCEKGKYDIYFLETDVYFDIKSCGSVNTISAP